MKPSHPLGLRHAADLRAIGFLTLQTLIMIGLFTGIYRNLWAWYAAAWLTVIAANVKHNHMHRRMFKSGAANLVMDHWLGFMTGTTSTSIITEHNLRHHGHSNDENDFVRCQLVGFRSQVLNVICFFPRAEWELYFKKPLDFRLWWRTNRRLFWRGLAEQVTLAGFFTTLMVLNWKITLLCVVLPWIHGQWWLITFNLFQHQELEQEDPWQNSRNITGRLFNFFFFNIGYHTGHHLKPTLHWSELPAFHDREIAPRIKAHLVSPSLWAFYYDWFSKRSVPPIKVHP
jgi:fatty acid desaturase